MFYKITLSFLFAIPLMGSSLSYLKDIHPILEKRCAVCHSCYNAPCQLKMEAFEGIDRGGSKKAVYMATRLRAQDPTRLFIDANTTEQWRAKDFFSVTNESNQSILQGMLDLKKLHPDARGSYYAESEDITCVNNQDELESYRKKHPNWGMPYGFPPLKKDEYEAMSRWLAQGAKGPTQKEQLLLIIPSSNAAKNIRKWESFLNQNDPKHQVTSRYLYEHFFLAHIRFGTNSGREFFEIVRSSTPSGEPINILPTVRPYDDPKCEHVYYRFRKIHATITHKTHMVVMLDDERLARYNDLFIAPKWIEAPHILSYDSTLSANPLIAYAQIPAESRYKFLLDNSQYIVDTFIRGPVCKGQLALNVIEDHFWVMFMDPKYDLGVKYPEFYREQQENLTIPNEAGSDMRVWNVFTNKYINHYEDYYAAKTVLYDKYYPKGLPLESIWRGERPVDVPILTVYRHFDSASVHRGVKGEYPKTAWVMDYAQFERTYYALAAGFDVFGNISHQTNIRRFMDSIREDGELNFTHYLPRNARYAFISSWYLNDRIDPKYFERFQGTFDTPIEYKSSDPKRELIEKVVEKHILPSTNISFDTFNYFRANEEFPKMPTVFKSKADYMQGFRALTAPGTGFIRKVNEFGVDVLYIRIRNTPQGNRFVSMVINRWHNSVNTIFKESSQLDPSKDTIDFFADSIASYPNYFIDVDFSQLPDLFDMLQNYDGSEPYKAKLNKYGINRTNENFWEVFDAFQENFNKSEPIESGLYDLNRYYNKATENDSLASRLWNYAHE
jgi:hypothetical protein